MENPCKAQENKLYMDSYYGFFCFWYLLVGKQNNNNNKIANNNNNKNKEIKTRLQLVVTLMQL